MMPPLPFLPLRATNIKGQPMHDTLIINIPIQKTYVRHLGGVEFGLVADLQYFGIKTCGGIRFDVATGQTEYYDIKSPFDKLPSSFADMAVKFYHHTKNCVPYLAINASPKFLQGHNVFGSDFVYHLVSEMLGVLRDAYPVMYSFLDVANAEFARIDVTYSARLPHDDLMLQVIDMMGRISNNQRKPDAKRNVFANTRYWGIAKSRVGYCKIYGKDNEIADTIKTLRRKARADSTHAKNLLNNVFTHDLEIYAKNLLRLEATNKKEMLVKMGMPSNVWQFIIYQNQNKDALFKLWEYWFNPILESVKGEVMMNIDDTEVLNLCKDKLKVITPAGNTSYTKALNAYRFYVFLKEKGFNHAKDCTNDRTFQRNVKSLIDIGIPRSHLQNLNGRENKIMPLIELIKIDCNNQTPPNYQPAKSRYHGEFDEYLNHLRFVA